MDIRDQYKSEDATKQDEAAYFLMDELFEGRARKLGEVEEEFRRHNIPAMNQYFVKYGISITKTDVPGTRSRWAYKGPTQIQRVKDDVHAGKIVAGLISQCKGVIPRGSCSAPAKSRIAAGRLQQAINRCFRELGYYNVDGYVQFVGKELEEVDRDWVFDELKWLSEEEGFPLDADDAWLEFGDIWRTRVTEAEAYRCIEIANMYESTDVKAIFPVSS